MKRKKTSTLKWLYQVPKRKRRIVLALSVLQILSGLSGVATALLLRQIVDSATNGDSNSFGQALVLIGLLIVSEQGIYTLIRWLRELGKSTFENIFKLRLTENILLRSYASISAIHSGEWMNRLTNDTRVVAEGYTEIIPGTAGMLMRLCSALVMIIILDSRFALLIFIGGLLVIILTYLFRKRLKTLHKRMQEADGVVRIFLQERIASLMTVKSFVAEEKTRNIASEKMEDHKYARMKRSWFSNICNIGFGLGIDALYLLGICYCAWGMLKGNVSYGTLIAVMQLLSEIQTPVASISGFLPKYYVMLASAERLMEVEEYPEDRMQNMLSQGQIEVFYHNHMAAFGLHHADYTYYPTGESDETSKARMPVVFHGLTLEIRKGGYVAFTGHSGCGKSTVLKLLMSMYPLDGGTRSILCNDGKVIPLTAEYRRLFAYVPQGNQLMTGTIREIVAFAEDGEPDGSRIENALWIACASEFVGELENGIDTQLGERGTGLSEGQMQRIAIARALYSDAPILLLDEATSALDATTEEKLLFNLRNLTDKTVIIVTHRPAALGICDRILEFTENGVKDSWRKQ